MVCRHGGGSHLERPKQSAAGDAETMMLQWLWCPRLEGRHCPGLTTYERGQEAAGRRLSCVAAGRRWWQQAPEESECCSIDASNADRVPFRVRVSL